jgi:hypothetical protein
MPRRTTGIARHTRVRASNQTCAAPETRALTPEQKGAESFAAVCRLAREECYDDEAHIVSCAEQYVADLRSELATLRASLEGAQRPACRDCGGTLPLFPDRCATCADLYRRRMTQFRSSMMEAVSAEEFWFCDACGDRLLSEDVSFVEEVGNGTHGMVCEKCRAMGVEKRRIMLAPFQPDAAARSVDPAEPPMEDRV